MSDCSMTEVSVLANMLAVWLRLHGRAMALVERTEAFL